MYFNKLNNMPVNKMQLKFLRSTQGYMWLFWHNKKETRNFGKRCEKYCYQYNLSECIRIL
jgi:hypothetical protein